jgi:hypothetical protein
MYSSNKENLISVNISNPTNNLLIKKNLFDFRAVSTCNLAEISWRESCGVIDFRP